jgi:uncharacterized integral membrane protein (TIGR00698 family)
VPTLRPAAAVPGLALCAALTAAAYGAARLPPLGVVGPVVLALLAGVAVGATATARRHAETLAPGVRVAARVLLKVGIVLLGVRLDARALVDLGPWVLVGSVLGAAVAFAAIEAAGRALRVPVDLRRSVAIGTAICGASAIAAAMPVLRARPAHASVAIGAISLLGTLGVLGFAAADALALAPAAWVAALAGATLQEVGHVVAAGAAVGGAEGDLALLVKLSRVVLLAPALLLLAFWGRAARSPEAAPSPDGAGAPPVAAPRPAPAALPPFVLGFLALGAATSAGLLPAPVVAAAATSGALLTAVAMAAIGLGVDVRGLGAAGRAALALGAIGFGALVLALGGYYALVLT